jgi:hypothetical protein
VDVKPILSQVGNVVLLTATPSTNIGGVVKQASPMLTRAQQKTLRVMEWVRGLVTTTWVHAQISPVMEGTAAVVIMTPLIQKGVAETVVAVIEPVLPTPTPEGSPILLSMDAAPDVPITIRTIQWKTASAVYLNQLMNNVVQAHSVSSLKKLKALF